VEHGGFQTAICQDSTAAHNCSLNMRTRLWLAIQFVLAPALCLSEALSHDTVDGRIKYHPDMCSRN
jgi:hypothetical protein